MQPGEEYTAEKEEQVRQAVGGLAVFDKVEVTPERSPEDPAALDLHIKLHRKALEEGH